MTTMMEVVVQDLDIAEQAILEDLYSVAAEPPAASSASSSSGERIECKDCVAEGRAEPRTFPTNRDFKQHWRGAHGAGVDQRRCSMCNRVFLEVRYRKKHQLICAKRRVGGVGGRSHRRSKAAGTTYTCASCGKCFSSLAIAKAHSVPCSALANVLSRTRDLSLEGGAVVQMELSPTEEDKQQQQQQQQQQQLLEEPIVYTLL